MIEFCTNSKISFAEKSMDKIPSPTQLNTWITSTSQIILNNVILQNFWFNHSLERPLVPTELCLESDNKGFPVLHLILWSSFSDLTPRAIISRLKGGLSPWKCSESYSDIDWVHWYIKCIMGYLRFYTHRMTKQIQQENVLSEFMEQQLLESIFL